MLHPFSGKKVLLATPVFGGHVPLQYFHSIMDTILVLTHNKIGFSIINEARNLIHQARNRSAHYALNNGFDKIIFIDADIKWQGMDVLRLLASKKRIVGGLYPLKTFPIKLNFVPMQGIYKTETFVIKEYIESYAEKDTGEVEIHMLPTGFMCIDTSVFKELEPIVESYKHRDQYTREHEYEKMFFPFKIAEDGFILTEDWGFCDLVRTKLNEKVYWNTNVVVDHVGNHTYSAKTPIEESYHKLDIHEKTEMLPNPFKDWPRNLQCFCGSGKKFKKCHDGQFENKVTAAEAKSLKEDFDKTLAYVEERKAQGVGYKLDEKIL